MVVMLPFPRPLKSMSYSLKPRFDQFKNRLHGVFQYTRGYKVRPWLPVTGVRRLVRPNIRKKFKRMGGPGHLTP